jgi:hypothetical protein
LNVVTASKRPRPNSSGNATASPPGLKSLKSSLLSFASTSLKEPILSPETEFQVLKADIIAKIKRMHELRNNVELAHGCNKEGTMQIFNIESDGRAGHVMVLREGFIYHEELLMAIQTIPEQIDNPKCEKARKKRQLKKVVFGSKVFFIPTECHVLSNSQYSWLMTAAAIKKKLDDLFDGEQCYLNKEAMIILTAFGLHNYGGSDRPLKCVLPAHGWHCFITWIWC